MGNKTSETQVNNGMVKVVLRCGRNMSSEYNYDNDGCGNYEDSTSNQTAATCC